MNRTSCHNLPEWWRKCASAFLAFFWILGLTTGVLTVLSAGDLFFATMRSAIFSRVSIPGFASAVFLPFLFSAFAVYIHCPFLLLPIAFVKAFLFSYLGLGLIGAFGSAGWLIRVLLLFSDTAMLPILFWFWSRHISGKLCCLDHVLIISVLLAVLISCTDYCIISPFLATLIT